MPHAVRSRAEGVVPGAVVRVRQQHWLVGVVWTAVGVDDAQGQSIACLRQAEPDARRLLARIPQDQQIALLSPQALPGAFGALEAEG
jgi:hypothetical protein